MSRGCILVGLDGSTASDAAVGVAIEEAVHRRVPLLAVHSWLLTDRDLPVEGRSRVDPAIRDQLLKALTARMEVAVGDRPVDRLDCQVVYGYAGRVLAGLSSGPVLAVVGAGADRPFREWPFGSVSRYVVEHARCPVMVVRGVPASPGRRVVVGVDGSQASLAALSWADGYAVIHRIPLVAVVAGGPSSAWAPFRGPPFAVARTAWSRTARATLDSCLREALPAQRTGAATAVVTPGPATSAVLGLVDERDLVVVGRRRPHGLAGFSMRSVERKLLAEVPGSIVVVSSDERCGAPQA